jgi:hypothetical protein
VNTHWLTPLAEMVDRERPAALDRDLEALQHDPIRLCRLLGVVGRAAEEPNSRGGEQQDRAATWEPTAIRPLGRRTRVACGHVIA